MMIGRNHERAALSEALASVRATGRGEVALIVGEAGVGKSHMLSALVEEARGHGVSAQRGRCFADTMLRAFSPWAEALNGRGVFSAPPSPLSWADERTRAFESVLREVTTQPSPQIVTIEDLHWADRDSVALFLHLARFALDAALLLVGTLRAPDLDGGRRDELDVLVAELARIERSRRVTLYPFSADDIAAYVSASTGAHAPQSVVRAIHGETGGNPLYVRELLRHLIEEGRLTARDGTLSTDFSLSKLALPSSLIHVVRQRVARLSAPCVALLRCAAVAEGPTPLATLARAARLEAYHALDAVDAAVASGLLREEDGRYALVHAVVRRALYEDLGADGRARTHRALALALEDEPGADRARLAAHYHRSNALPGSAPGVDHAVAAAEHARAVGAHERSAALLAIACELAARGDPLRHATLTARRSVACAEALDFDGALSALDAAERAAERVGALGHLPETLAQIAQALDQGGVPRSAWQPLVARGLARVGDARDLTWARLSLLASHPVPIIEGPVWVSRFGGFDPDAVRLLRDAGSARDFATTVEPHDTRTLSDSIALRARANAWSDDGAALRVLDACMRDVFFRSGDMRAAAAFAAALMERATRVGSLSAAASARVIRGCARAALGALDEAREELSAVQSIARRLGSVHRMNAVGPLALELVLALLTGSDAAGATARLSAFVSTPAAGATPFGQVALNLALLGASIQGDAALASRLFAHNLRVLETLDPSVNEWGASRDCGVTAAWRFGRVDLAPRYLAFCGPEYSAAGNACWTCVEHSAACMAALTGDLSAARERFALARARYFEDGRAPSLARCDLDEAQALRAQPAARGGTPDGLSPREVEVLALLASGLANKEIAARLFISVPTVERHVANVYQKIGRGRANATAYALRAGLIKP